MTIGRADGDTGEDTLWLGWSYHTAIPDPGPPPSRPDPAERARPDPQWVAERRRAEAEINRPLRLALRGLAGIVLVTTVLWASGVLPGPAALVVTLCCLTPAVPAGVALWQGHRVTRARITREEHRPAEDRRRADQAPREPRADATERYDRWRVRARAFHTQPRWYPVTIPITAPRVSVAGGDETGWSAALTTLGVTRLRAGGWITVVDLAERAVAGDLVSLAEECAVSTRVWMLPSDLPRLDLGVRLDTEARVELLSSAAVAGAPERDVAADAALLRRVLEVLGPTASMPQIGAGLRAVAAEPALGAPEGAGLVPLGPKQYEFLRDMALREPATRERARELRDRLAAFEVTATGAVAGVPAQVRVIAAPTADTAAGRLLGTYVVGALRHALYQGEFGAENRRPWRHTVAVCGADTLEDDQINLLVSAAEQTATGLALFYRDLSDGVMARIGRDSAPVGVMRPRGGDHARVAAYLGYGRRLRTHRLTEVVGEALSGAVPESYPRSDAAPPMTAEGERPAPRSVPDARLARCLDSATLWGRVTRQAAELDTPNARDPVTRVREFPLDSRRLRRLPPTAMLVDAADGLVLADANPGILGLPTAGPRVAAWTDPHEVASESPGFPVPDLDPPGQRLDRRRRRVS